MREQFLLNVKHIGHYFQSNVFSEPNVMFIHLKGALDNFSLSSDFLKVKFRFLYH